MSTEKIRHDFEQHIIRRDGSIWVTVMGDQRSYNEPIERDFSVWCESRAAIEVEWPDQHTYTAPDCAGAAILDCRTAFNKAVKVKP